MKRLLLPLVAALLLAERSAWSMTEDAPADAKREALVRLMPAKSEKRLRDYLPKVADPEVQAIFEDPQLIVYTDREMPKAYQFWNGQMPGVHRASYNISANGSEPFGNGNREFPWGTPAGTHRTKNVWTFRFLRLPRDEDGKVHPIVWFRSRQQGDGQNGYAWRFPTGAAVGEVLMMRGADGRDYCFEVRVRFREVDDWAIDVFRPFPRAEDLAEGIKELRPNWQERPALASAVKLLSGPTVLPERKLADQHPRKTFQQSMGVYVLPSLEDDALVAELLTKTTFKSALGNPWAEGANGAVAAAPTTEAAFHIVPAKYDAGFVEVDRASCMRCHKTVNQPVDKFQSGRDWYGRIRGSDGIFSFHPFDPNSISGNGYPVPVRMRDELVSAGVIERYDAKKHDRLRYAQVPQLIE
ncbi:MAG TPA: hypothetical protein VFE62_19805 [Gemmataceae bacterium]|nr:hypothetical protein [Gemmataceae bacterium]